MSTVDTQHVRHTLTSPFVNDCSSPGGLLALDDCFNQDWPGVSEGTLRYLIEHPAHYTPLVVGFNKVLLQKSPASLDIDSYLRKQAPDISRRTVEFVSAPVIVFTGALLPAFDLAQSSPELLVPQPIPPVTVRLETDLRSLVGSINEVFNLSVRVLNDGNEPLTQRGRIGISYHLLSDDGTIIRWDNPRCYIAHPLQPQEQYVAQITLDAPSTPASYVVELDVVWEGVTWLSQRGLRTIAVNLRVE